MNMLKLESFNHMSFDFFNGYFFGLSLGYISSEMGVASMLGAMSDAASKINSGDICPFLVDHSEDLE